MRNLKKYMNKYYKKTLIKLKNIHASPYAVACGFACGVAISFTPFIGFHLVLAALTAFILRGNIISSALGTIIGNPWTFPFIWISVLYTGRFFLGMDSDGSEVNFTGVFKSATDAIFSLNFKSFGHDVWPIIFPMMVGCIPYYIVSWLISFKIIKTTVIKLQSRSNKKASVK